MEFMTESFEVYREIDKKLMQASKYLMKIYYYLQPFNVSEEKRLFLQNKNSNPVFSYYPLDYFPEEISESLKSIEFPNDVIGDFLRQKRDELLLRNEIISFRGNSDIVIAKSSELNGIPSEELVSYAETVLKDKVNLPKNLPLKSEKRVKIITSEEMKNKFNEELKKYGLNDWEAQFTEKSIIEVNPEMKRVFVPRKRFFSESESSRLVVHEIGVHVIRSVNGYNQPLKIFALGLPNYLPTEEGLALHYESGVFNEDENNFKKAALVVAVDSLVKKMNFKSCFAKLKDYGFGDDDAWSICLRVYRGGGYVKDHLYLQGFLEVNEFIEKGGDAKKLFIGKIAINDLPLVDKMIQAGILNEAKIIPSFIK